MPAQDPFQVEGLVIDCRPNGTWLVELSNGHRLTAFTTRKAKSRTAGLRSGGKVRLQLTPYDLSVGRILTVVTI